MRENRLTNVAVNIFRRWKNFLNLESHPSVVAILDENS